MKILHRIYVYDDKSGSWPYRETSSFNFRLVVGDMLFISPENKAFEVSYIVAATGKACVLCYVCKRKDNEDKISKPIFINDKGQLVQ